MYGGSVMATLTLSEEFQSFAPAPAHVPVPAAEAGEPGDLKSRLLAYERSLITTALAESGGNQRRAARRLGILPTTLHEKMKRLGVRASAFLPPVAGAPAADDLNAS
jgi:DNA-binding NtrC family response regulator